MPFILGGPEHHLIDSAGEHALVLCRGIRESQSNSMIIVLIFIDQHQRPLPVRPLNRVGGNQEIALFVFDIARRLEQLVRRVHRLDPLFRDYLCG